MPNVAGLSQKRFAIEQNTFDNPPRHTAPEKLLADLLKRQGRRIMGDVTECPSDTLPAHIARLDDWREVVAHLLRHDLSETPESRLSGAQLCYPATLADLVACAEITRRNHRAPVFVNSRDEQIEKILRGIDQIAGLIATNDAAVEFFAGERGQQ